MTLNLMRRALSARLSLSSIMMIERVYSVFLCFLLISVLFFPLAAAGRVLLGTPQKGDEGGDHSNGRSKIHVNPSHSGQAGSALGHSSPSHATPSGVHTGAHAVTSTANTANRAAQVAPCGSSAGQPFGSNCVKQRNPERSCGETNRDCIRS
ncbi:uncharacterized protein LOC100263000 isoform X1 [Vitis vinifera]|nr:uncharacterized protein LOC100263000 isoform X1 [Vitis vinifera]RVW45581.1 hypothetical protein CK203_092099 [Vitis vinifera]|eukprot:XP_002280734.2 PREDICTED: uncharacterized protein LOC100263000 isoform X1 [Vitis vinifera]